jgi:predicted Fe-Mo cluster-binding NifX family protein
MEKLTVAFATNDGEHFMSNHFGDADYYHIYEINPTSAKYIKVIQNTTEEEEIHADPKKAKGISQLLKEEKVNVVGSKVFGPNIKRIKKTFVCLLLKDTNIKDAIKKVSENYDKILSEWNKGEERNFLSI